MNTQQRALEEGVSILGVLSAACLVFNALALPLHQEQVFLHRNTISAIELVMLLGFGLIFVFNVASIGWAIRGLWQGGRVSNTYAAILALGVLCVVLAFGQKVMIDEIGRETLLGWETAGEWVILYGQLLIQFAYILFVITRLLRIRRSSAP